MNQLTWTYIADNGEKHIVGIAHGPESGNLLVYCNKKVIIIDFKIFETKSYSFFIDEQLCEIKVNRHAPKEFSYGFEINNKADTPRNRARNAKEKQYLYQSVAFVCTLAVAVAIFVFIGNYWNKEQSKNLASHLNHDSIYTSAKIIDVKPNKNGTTFINYYFSVNGTPFQSSLTRENPSSSKLPIETGDEFSVRYEPNNPAINLIDLNRPTPSQIERYQRRLQEKLERIDVSYGDHFVCVFNQLYLLKGLDGINDLYFQDTSPSINQKHNEVTYAKLIQEEEVQNILQGCQ